MESENQRLNRTRETLKVRKAELEEQAKVSQDAVISLPKLEGFVERIQGRISSLDFESKRLALDMLDIIVWLDGDNVEITGSIDTSIVTTPSGGHEHKSNFPFCLKIA